MAPVAVSVVGQHVGQCMMELERIFVSRRCVAPSAVSSKDNFLLKQLYMHIVGCLNDLFI